MRPGHVAHQILVRGGSFRLLATASAHAHGFSSVVYVDATSHERDHVRATLGLEYDLLIVSAAHAQSDDPSCGAGQPTWEARGDAAMTAAADANADTIVAYVTKRFAVAGCTPRREGG